MELEARARALSERAAAHHRRVRAEEAALGAEAKALAEALRERRRGRRAGGGAGGGAGVGAGAGVGGLVPGGDEEKALVQARRVLEGAGPGGDLRYIGGMMSPKTPPLLLYMLGRCSQVVVSRPDLGIRLKEEYYAFRDKTVGIFVAAPTVLLLGLHRAHAVQAAEGEATLLPVLGSGIQLYVAWMLYFYTSVALRENVLVMNGSNIRAWWMQHHYISIVVGLLMLTMPVESDAFKHFGEGMLLFNIMQGLVMILQTYYQRRRLYTRIALGKSSKMDVASADSSAASGQMLLFPVLFLLQAYQLYMGLIMIVYHAGALASPEGWLDEFPQSSDLRSSRTVFFCGVFFIVLGLGNFFSTLATLNAKRRKVMRRISSRESFGDGKNN